MSLAPCDLETEALETDLERARARASARGVVLRELSAIGMRLARALARQVEAVAEAQGDGALAVSAGSGAGADPGLAFSRISRAVRLTLALEARQDEDLLGLGEKLQAERAEAAERRRRDARAPIDQRRQAIQARLEDEVEAGIDPDADDDECYERWDAFNERLSEAAEAEDFLERPFEDLIWAIRKDLGLPLQHGIGDTTAGPPTARTIARDLTPEDVAAAWSLQARGEAAIRPVMILNAGGSG